MAQYGVGRLPDAQVHVNGHGTAAASVNGASTNGITNGSSTTNGNGIKLTIRKKLDRKKSSPMLPTFMVSAPGKVIVFGEHAVVHGKAAIAAAISLRSYLLVTTLSKSRRTVTLRFPDIDFNHTWNIDELPWSTFSHPSKKKYYYDLVTSLDPELVAAIQPYLADVSGDKPSEIRKVHQNSAGSFLYMFLSLGSQSFPGCQYTLRSTIPIGAGLGSSATIAVCMSAALLLQLRTLSGPHPDQPADEARLQVERINRWALVYEMFIHGNPSGVDNTVATQGKAVLFQRTDYSRPPSVRPLYEFPELPLLLVDTRTPKSTAHEVAKVERLRHAHPKLVGSILDAVDKVTESARDLIEERSFDTGDEECLRRVGELMTINHGLLVSLGVSHPRLERVRELVDHEGIGWTKLTGAGGGGCSITLLRPGVPREKLDRLEERLEEEGYQKFETTLGGDGVGVLWPAVLKNGMDEDEEGGMEIDLENFLNAEGNEGVERLVGVHGGWGRGKGGSFGGLRVRGEGKGKGVMGKRRAGLVWSSLVWSGLFTGPEWVGPDAKG
ncbi:ribosomal protein S5 domain 2-type protein [Bombardia bombarda]|uniref:Mevalonate kinase n=1 Tax=Bombardia bombarda TaxID=252184 RepID=A0AA39XJT3_9PEZI|nr:ribosomal protein S5 domain 2-type protein [Bombardia bombarda]